MLGDLGKKQIIDLLHRQVVGRVGCHVNGETYIVPINYIYNNDSIYAHSGNGKKIEMMRQNPKVCFQVDEITDTFSWQSVILWGTFEELNGVDRQQAMQGIIYRIMPLANKHSEESSHGIDIEQHNDLIVYRIRISEVTGRFESHED